MKSSRHAVFDHISKHLEARLKAYSATRLIIFNSLLGGCKCRKTQSFVFCLLLDTRRIFRKMRTWNRYDKR